MILNCGVYICVCFYLWRFRRNVSLTGGKILGVCKGIEIEFSTLKPMQYEEEDFYFM